MSKEVFGLSQDCLREKNLLPTLGQFHYCEFSTFADLLKYWKIFRRGHYNQREKVENDPSFQQLIVYGLLVKPDGRFLIYERGGSNYGEERVTGMTSLGIGGHIEPDDNKSLAKALYRELWEEIEILIRGEKKEFLHPNQMKTYLQITPIALVKDERSSVGEVHFGVVFVVLLKENVDAKVNSENGENRWSEWVTPKGYLELINSKQINPEGWAEIVFEKLISAKTFQNILNKK